jgi:hypothetical protein
MRAVMAAKRPPASRKSGARAKDAGRTAARTPKDDEASGVADDEDDEIGDPEVDELDGELDGEIGEPDVGDDDGGGAGDEDEAPIAPVDPASRKASDEVDEDDEDLRTEDDVEADLSSLLQEKLASPEEAPAEDEEEPLADDRTDGLERLQPRRADEVQCTQCFLLVRSHAPGCPVEDDHCPLFR